ncbi:TPA: hypothetical protein ACVU5P_004266 [Vibrio parahaemolyticus]
MTPLELLEDVKARFPVLLHDEMPKLLALLRKAIARYQDYAGFVVKKRITQADAGAPVELPSDYLALIGVTDDTGRYVQATEWQSDNQIELKLRGRESYPLVMQYMRKVDKDEFDTFNIPSTAAGLIADYLEALIAVPNCARRRTVSIAGKLDATDIPTEDSLNARLVELEQKISDNRAILPVFSIR